MIPSLHLFSLVPRRICSRTPLFALELITINVLKQSALFTHRTREICPINFPKSPGRACYCGYMNACSLVLLDTFRFTELMQVVLPYCTTIVDRAALFEVATRTSSDEQYQDVDRLRLKVSTYLRLGTNREFIRRLRYNKSAN